MSDTIATTNGKIERVDPVDELAVLQACAKQLRKLPADRRGPALKYLGEIV